MRPSRKTRTSQNESGPGGVFEIILEYHRKPKYTRAVINEILLTLFEKQKGYDLFRNDNAILDFNFEYNILTMEKIFYNECLNFMIRNELRSLPPKVIKIPLSDNENIDLPFYKKHISDYVKNHLSKREYGFELLFYKHCQYICIPFLVTDRLTDEMIDNLNFIQAHIPTHLINTPAMEAFDYAKDKIIDLDRILMRMPEKILSDDAREDRDTEVQRPERWNKLIEDLARQLMDESKEMDCSYLDRVRVACKRFSVRSREKNKDGSMSPKKWIQVREKMLLNARDRINTHKNIK